MNRIAPRFCLFLVLPIFAVTLDFPNFATAARRNKTAAPRRTARATPQQPRPISRNPKPSCASSIPSTSTAKTASPTKLPAPLRRGEFRVEAQGVDPLIYLDVHERWGHEPRDEEYDLAFKNKLMPFQEKPGAKPSWQVYVPPTYQPETPHGVLVFINSTETGRVPAEWKAILDKHRLIWVAANNAGNDHKPEWRHALAVQGLCQLEEHYTIDYDRVYISGFADGGRIASIVMLKNVDIFAGGFPLGGCTPYRPAVLGDKVFPAEPDITTLDRFLQASRENRFVFLTGDNDIHREQTQATFVLYQSDAFKYVTYLQVPGLGQALPAADWFERGLISLDAPLIDAAPGAFEKAQANERLGSLGHALDNYRSAFSHGGKQDFVPEARQKYLALKQQYERELAALEAKVAANDLNGMDQKIALFRNQWLPGADADTVWLELEVEEKRKK